MEPASALLTAPETLAESLLRFANDDDIVGRLKSIDWSEVGDLVFAAQWRAVSEHFAASLETFNVDSLPCGDAETLEAGRRLLGPGGARLVDRDAAHERANRVLSAALGCCLMSRGWSLKTSIGEPLLLVRGPEKIDPQAIVAGLSKGTLDRDEWKRRTVALGLAGCPLST